MKTRRFARRASWPTNSSSVPAARGFQTPLSEETSPVNSSRSIGSASRDLRSAARTTLDRRLGAAELVATSRATRSARTAGSEVDERRHDFLEGVARWCRRGDRRATVGKRLRRRGRRCVAQVTEALRGLEGRCRDRGAAPRDPRGSAPRADRAAASPKHPCASFGPTPLVRISCSKSARSDRCGSRRAGSRRRARGWERSDTLSPRPATRRRSSATRHSTRRPPPKTTPRRRLLAQDSLEMRGSPDGPHDYRSRARTREATKPHSMPLTRVARGRPRRGAHPELTVNRAFPWKAIAMAAPAHPPVLAAPIVNESSPSHHRLHLLLLAEPLPSRHFTCCGANSVIGCRRRDAARRRRG